MSVVEHRIVGVSLHSLSFTGSISLGTQMLCSLLFGHRWWRRNAAFQEVSRELRRISYCERSYHRGVKGEKREDERLWWRGV